MSTNQIDNELFEVILQNAFSESFNRKLESYEASAATLSDAVPTRKQKKRAQKAYKRALRKPLNCIIALRRAAVAALIVFSILNALMLCSPKVQAAVKETIIGFFDKYTAFDFSNNDDFITVGTYKIGYVPSGYQLIESKTTKGYDKYTFSNGSDDIDLRIMSSSISEVGIDRENRAMKPVKIKDYVAYTLIHNDSNEPTIVIWGDENRSFFLAGKLSLSELTKIANSFK